MTPHNKTPHHGYLAEAHRLAAAGKGRQAAAGRRIQAIALVILAAEATRIAEEELADAVRAASACRLTVAELAAAAGKTLPWARRTAGR